MERSGKIYQKSAKRREKKNEEHDQQKRIFMTLENDLLYRTFSIARISLALSLSLSLSLALCPSDRN